MRKQEDLNNLTVHINGERTFIINQRILCSYSGKLKKMVKQLRPGSSVLDLKAFPGGPEGFESIARFCYNKGRILVKPSNVCILHCSALFMEMSEELAHCNLLTQAETFLDGLFYWTWQEVLTSLKTLDALVPEADASGLLDRLVSSLLAKIAANSEMPINCSTPFQSSPSCSSSPDTSGFRISFTSSLTKTPDTHKPCVAREWWFEDLTILHPMIVEKITRVLGAHGVENRNMVLTRFVLHYLKSVNNQRSFLQHRDAYGDLADTAVCGVVAMGRAAFSCRGLFWVLRVVSCMGVGVDCRLKLESLMGSMLDQASLDDLLVSGRHDAVYDVDLVLRLVKIFVGYEGVKACGLRMKKVGRLMDQYLAEISPDQSLKVSKFQSLAESLPDEARDCFDGVYRALDVYLESHPNLSLEDRARLCRCLNYEKLSAEACRDLAKNPRVPPRAAVRALLVSQQPRFPGSPSRADAPRMGVYRKGRESYAEDKEELKANLERMQRRVVELERTCREMQGKMSVMGNTPSQNHHRHQQQQQQHRGGRGLPKLC